VDRVLDIAPIRIAEVLRLQRELGVSFVVAQTLCRRGLSAPRAARAWIDADEHHPFSAFAGINAAVSTVLPHVDAGTRITVHGDYDVDGVCSTAILVRVLRCLGADVDWYLPSRQEDGYGLAAATVDRLAARGTRLLITADCAITAVAEVAAARAAGIDVVVTDHHTPRADGALPDAPIVHPVVGGYPCTDLCAGAVAYKFAGALLAGAGRDPAGADDDLDLVALSTIADCVTLRGENRRLVREGLAALRTTKKVGLRALMRSAQVDPGAVDAQGVSFRLAPRINAAGRLYRADAGLELVLTDDADRAAQIAGELDAANAERRHVEQRIAFEAEAQVARAGVQPAYVLAGDDWHPGVIGIVASRIAERHHRPVVMVALTGERGTGSGRSIPGFDLLAGLEASAQHLIRHGGHRAAAGCTVDRAALDDFRAAFCAHARAVLTPADLVPRERVDAVVSGDELGLDLAEELELLAPFGIGNPQVRLLVPAARLSDPRAMGEGKHLRFSVEAGGVRARAVAFGTTRLPDDDAVDATFSLELNEWGGTTEPRLILKAARSSDPGPISLVGEPVDPVDAALEMLDGPLVLSAAPVPGGARDRRGGGIAGVVGALVASGEPVLVVCADAVARRRHLAGRLGGFDLCSWVVLERDPGLAAPYAHVVALDPPPGEIPALNGTVHLAWGAPETTFAFDLRAACAALFRAVAAGHPLETIAAASPRLAGLALRVLSEVGLVEVDPVGGAARILSRGRTELDGSPTFRAAQARLPGSAAQQPAVAHEELVAA
jgi:single-stranded-DNA-specific exonuclease